jgi:hypothetical protein
LHVKGESGDEIEGKSLEEVMDMILESERKRQNTILEMMQSLPPPTPMEAALFHLQRIGHKLRHCPNPECPAPYFITDKRGQKYCSPVCAEPAQRASKLRWWNENRASETKGGKHAKAKKIRRSLLEAR